MKDPQEWRAKALCPQVDPEIFFPEKGKKAPDAKRVCFMCEVREQCLDFALWHADREGFDLEGVWGGMSHDERKKLRTRLRRDGDAA